MTLHHDAMPRKQSAVFVSVRGCDCCGTSGLPTHAIQDQNTRASCTESLEDLG
jgi:hypothetical protein